MREVVRITGGQESSCCWEFSRRDARIRILELAICHLCGGHSVGTLIVGKIECGVKRIGNVGTVQMGQRRVTESG